MTSNNQDNNNQYPREQDGFRGRLCWQFLSRLKDHHQQSIFWMRGQYSLYVKKFRNLPEEFLKAAFTDYLSDIMPSWLPTLPQVAEYLYNRPDFQSHWHTVNLDETYCIHCRTDDIGKQGGFRMIHYYGYIPQIDRIDERIFGANCDCPLGSKVTRCPLQAELRSLQSWDPEAEIHVDYFDVDRGRKIQAREQSSIAFQDSLDKGILRKGDPENNENPQAYYAVWTHPFWTSSMGKLMCMRFGFKMPPNVQEQYEMRPRPDKARRFMKQQQIRKEAAQDTTDTRSPIIISGVRVDR